jgi:Bacterial protein of unknown function (DUF922)
VKLFVASILIAFPFFNRAICQETINWSPTYKLKWEDFQGPPDSSSKQSATTAYYIIYTYSYTDSSLKFSVQCLFDKSKSWKKSTDSLLLKHEQGHFDIGEIFARKLQKAFTNYAMNSKTINEDLRQIYNNVMSERLQLNDLYDNETVFSQDVQAQNRWINYIHLQLQSML